MFHRLVLFDTFRAWVFLKISAIIVRRPRVRIPTPPSSIKVNDFVVFTGESKGWTVATTTPDVVTVSQGGTQDTYETNPGFQAIKAGAAVITITSPMGTVITLDLTIE